MKSASQRVIHGHALNGRPALYTSENSLLISKNALRKLTARPCDFVMNVRSTSLGGERQIETTKASPPIVLTIAGSDSGGGAGIQADLKTFAACGVFGCSAVTALTAQNTRGVSGIHEVPAGFLRQQIDSVLDDLQVTTIKIGMLPNVEVISPSKTQCIKYNTPLGLGCLKHGTSLKYIKC